ncbi:MAG: hypothetical protein V5B36_05290 [Candidatus Accumulibacter sp. UW25]
MRGDIAFGNEGMMTEMEEIAQPYLFKLKQTAGVKRLIERLWRRGDWQDVGQGFDAVETELRLAGWTRARRVVVLRRRVKSGVVADASPENPQPELQFLALPRRPNSGNTPSWSATPTTRSKPSAWPSTPASPACCSRFPMPRGIKSKR